MTTSPAVNVLLVEDDDKAARHIEGITRRETAFTVTRVKSPAEAEQALQHSAFAIALLSLELNTQPGLSAYALLRAFAPDLPVVVLAADDDETLALKAVHQGAADYLIRSQIYSTILVRSLKHAIEYSRAEAGKREAVSALVRSELRYRALFEQSRDAIFLTDASGVIVETNAAMREMFKATSLNGKPVSALFADPASAAVFEEEFAVKREVRDFEVHVRGPDDNELWALLTLAPRPDMREGSQGILHDITDRKHAEQRLIYSAYHDVLTALPNRALFMDRLDRALVRWQRHRDKFAVLFIDLNRFKVINDSLGHSAGDELLQRVGKLMLDCVRAEDTVARLGGDEYAVLVERVESTADVLLVAQRIQSALQRPLTIAGRQTVYVSCSIGIAFPDSDADKAEDLLRNADIAMYKSKAAGPASHTLYVPGMHTDARHLMELDMDLNQAVRAGEFTLHYQPIYDLQKNSISGFEALVRWNHPRRGLLMPHEFCRWPRRPG